MRSSNRQKYVNDQMALRRGKPLEDEIAAAAAAAKSAASGSKQFEEFYTLPAFLQPKPARSDGASDPNDMPVTDGWLVGIAEINLPIEYKMKNIERTETEKQLRANAPKRPFFANLPSNMGTNFQQHRRGIVLFSNF